MREGRWAEARAKLEQLKAEHPEYQRDITGRYIQVAIQESEVSQQLERARSLFAADRLDDAAAELDAARGR